MSSTLAMPSRKNKADLLEWLFAWEVICFSGQGGTSGLRFISNTVMGITLFITSFYIFMKRPKNKIDSSTAMMLFMVLWLSANTFLLTALGEGINQKLGLGLGPKLLPLSMYMGISTLSFRPFREKLLKALTILSAATMIAWTLHITLGIGSFGGHPAPTFYIFMDWGGRMASIYWEPGMYQIIMIFVLCLFFDELTKINLHNLKYYVNRFGIIVLAIIVCRSTMGYLCLMLLLGISFMFNDAAKKHKMLYVILLVMAMLCAMLIWNTDVVQKKIDPEKLRTGGSMLTRVIDNLALLNMSMVRPLTGLGYNSNAFARYGKYFGSITSSNGWFYLAAAYGWPFLLLLIYCMLKGLQRMNLGLPAWVMFMPIFLSQSDEYYALFPIIYIYIYKYKDYS